MKTIISIHVVFVNQEHILMERQHVNNVIQIVCLVIRQLVNVQSARMDIIHQGIFVSLVQLEHIHLMEYNALIVKLEQQTVNQHNRVVHIVNQEHMRM